MKNVANDKSYVYRNSRPLLTVENAGGAHLGNCYNSMKFLVTSLHPLSMEDIRALRNAGFLGYGQEFSCCQVTNDNGGWAPVPQKTLDWQTSKDIQPTGYDEVPCVEIDAYTRKPTGNLDLGKPAKKSAYFVYECEACVDSGD